MTCCAFADCGEPSCGVCSVLRRFPPIVRCDVLIDGSQCRYAVGHPAPCRSDSGQEKRAKPTRDGAPKLAGERKRKELMWRKRHRDGPFRSTA